SASCSSMTRTMTVRSNSRWRSSRTIWPTRADVFRSPREHQRHPVFPGVAPLALFSAVQLQCQPVHGSGDLAPLREPASRKAEGEIGAFDAALAQAHAGCRGLARTTRA